MCSRARIASETVSAVYPISYGIQSAFIFQLHNSLMFCWGSPVSMTTIESWTPGSAWHKSRRSFCAEPRYVIYILALSHQYESCRCQRHLNIPQMYMAFSIESYTFLGLMPNYEVKRFTFDIKIHAVNWSTRPKQSFFSTWNKTQNRNHTFSLAT